MRCGNEVFCLLVCGIRSRSETGKIGKRMEGMDGMKESSACSSLHRIKLVQSELSVDKTQVIDVDKTGIRGAANTPVWSAVR